MILTAIVVLLVLTILSYYISRIVYRPKYGVWFIAGAIGTGKSCSACYYVNKLSKSKHYKHFYSNVLMRKSTYLPDLVHILTSCPETLPEQSVIIIDEASLDFNSRSFSKTSLSLIKYFKLCRHYKHRVILISQTFTDTDKQIRDLSTCVQLVKPLIYSRLVMLVNCNPSFGVNPVSGDIQTTYKLGRVGRIVYLPKYYKWFDSYSK